MGAEGSLLSLEKYAIVRRALRSSPDAQKQGVLAKHGVSQAAWDQAESHWTAALEKDEGELLLRWAAARDAADALATKEPAADAAPAAPPAAVVAPVEEAPSSAPAVERVKPSFLIERSAPPAVGEAQSRWAAPAPYSPPAAPAPPGTSVPAQAGQTISVANLRGLLDPLPFEPARPGQVPTPPPQPAQSVASKAGETVSVANVRDFLAPLPFGASRSATPAPRAAPAPGVATPQAPRPGPQQTIDVDSRALRAALPFLGDAAKAPARPAAASPPAANAPANRSAPAPGPAEDGALAPLEPPAPPPPHGAFTLEQYAAFYAELSVYREWAAHVRARYGMTDDARWRSLQQTWQEQFRRDPSLYARWHDLHARYEQWFARARAAQR